MWYYHPIHHSVSHDCSTQSSYQVQSWRKILRAVSSTPPLCPGQSALLLIRRALLLKNTQPPVFVRQSAFHRHHSTKTAVLIVHKYIIQAFDNGQLTVMLFLDFSSAFDTVDHDIMLSILHHRFSAKRAALNWFHSYLTECSQTFSVGDSNSDSHCVSSSVPQGSILRPVEFVTYTEDVIESFDRHMANHTVRWWSTNPPAH